MSGTIVDERDKKDINRQLVFLEMHCIFACLKKGCNKTNELYKEVLPGISGVNNKFRRMMYGTDKADKAAQKSFREKFRFSNDLCTFSRDLLDYDRDNSIDTELLGKYAFYEYHTESVPKKREMRIYTNGVDEIEAKKIKDDCENAIKKYAEKVRNELVSGNPATKKAISETDIGKFIIGIGAATGVGQEVAQDFAKQLRSLLNVYGNNRSLITTAALDDKNVMSSMTGMEDKIKNLFYDVEALKRIMEIKAHAK